MKYLIRSLLIVCVLTLISCGGGTSTEFDSDLLNNNKDQIDADVTKAELIFVGTIKSIGTAPTYWSGITWSTQAVTYTVDAVLKGSYSDSEITIYHVLVDGSRHAADTPSLTDEIFDAGNKLIVFAKENDDYVELGEGWTVPKYMDFDENFGTIPYSAQNEQAVKSMINSSSKMITFIDITEDYYEPSFTGSTKVLTVNGSATDKESFNNLLDACKGKSTTLSDLVSMIQNSETYTVELNLVRDGENIFVDSFNGRKVDIDDLEKWHEGCNDKTDLCQLFGHILQEYWHASVTGDGYEPSHESALKTENQIRKDLGKTTTLTAHTGVWEGSDLYCSTTYNGNTELVKIGGGNKPYPESVTIKATAPAAPTDITVDDSVSCQITVGWTDNASDEDGFEIERREGEIGAWAVVHLVGPNTVAWTNTPANATPPLELDHEYCYRVRAYKTVDSTKLYSSYSDIACGVKQ